MNNSQGEEKAKRRLPWPVVLLAEHGETEFSASGDEDRIHGTKFDLPLTEEGHKQAARTAKKISEYDVASLEHSPLLRATQTAKAIEKETGVKAVPNKGLLPWDSGFLSGMTHGSAKELIRYYVKNSDETVRDGEPYSQWWAAYSKTIRKKLSDAEKTPGKVHVLGVHSSEVSAAPAVIRGDDADLLDEKLPRSGQIAALIKRGGQWKFMPEFS